MCAIVDASVKGEVFGRGRTRNPAATKFVDAIAGDTVTEDMMIRLVVGGSKLRNEMRGQRFERFLQQALQRGAAAEVGDDKVDRLERELQLKGLCRSNDAHIIALARVSGARLLFTNDRKLRADFENVDLVDAPRGKVYSTLEGTEYTEAHARLLRDSVCAT